MALHPQDTARHLLEDPHRFREGIAACLLMGVLYTVSVFVGYLHGFGAVMEPWLPIPARDYYLWETFFTIPAFFLILRGSCGYYATDGPHISRSGVVD